MRDTLELVDSNRLALGRDRLAAALADHGHVYDTKTEYRRAVDEALFGLGERRYAELMELLLQIRAPQLSKKPSEAALSEALTRALTPIGDAVIKSLADGLRSLDEEREEVQQLAAAQKAVHRFLEHYRGYSRVMLKRHAEGPRREQAELDRFGRAVIETTAELEQLQQSLSIFAAETALLQGERTQLDAEREALRDSAHAESERMLELADAAAVTAEERAIAAEQGLNNATATLQRSETDAGDDRAACAVADTQVHAAVAVVVAAAAEARIEHDHAALAVGRDPEALARDRAATTLRTARTREALARVTELITALEAAEGAVTEVDRREAETETRLAEADTERAIADVDDNSRASCLGLLAEFDLDVVMTSERDGAATPKFRGYRSPN
ncbi:DNA repair exonuclease SbcCD ATPase subunit [Cryobacterium sp. CAN_C3]|uniref:hypothetical protein n=1 Tax=unclassified Cryobacterium TaxID=2649013 RepID=UPI0018C9D30C|nr:hypothetical protein [Cryobacterium sp. CAN_C3]MEC5152689.1 DNA repair exonuclease SbcCD ATPase subunit [Cryobacterium sp. CAN_C3]